MEKIPKNPKIFECKICDYFTSNLKDYKKHILTLKHLNRTNLNNLEQKIPENPKEFVCSVCQKCYKARNSLWYHQQKCSTKKTQTNDEIQKNDIIDKDLIMMLIKENSELKNIMIKVIENGTHNTNSNNTHTNSHNKAFNLQFFLNETCKNAMNITDFVDSIKLQLSDLMEIGELGYVEGISKIIVKNLNNLDETIRPIHCTDKKRETFYVKDKGLWEKEDENKTKLTKVVKNIANKNIRLLPEFREKHPEYRNSCNKMSDTHDKIVIEAMTTDTSKNEKIIRNISKVTLIGEKTI